MYTIVVDVTDEIPPTPVSAIQETRKTMTVDCVAHDVTKILVTVENITSRPVVYDVFGNLQRAFSSTICVPFLKA